MSDFLVKKFIQNYNNVYDSKVREDYGILGSVVGVICNLLLFAVKLIIGVLLSSISITTDAINNLSDIGSSLVTLVGFKAANKPADKDHPFGHGRIEYVSALIVSFIIILVGWEFMQTAFNKIKNPTTIRFGVLPAMILILSMGVKLWMCKFNQKIGTKINSEALKASSLDSLSDVFATSATVLSLLVFHFFNLNIDGYIGILVALMVMYGGFSIAKDTLDPLLGQSADPELASELKKRMLNYPEIKGMHDLIVHNYGPGKHLATVHAEVSVDSDIISIHEIVDKAEREIESSLGMAVVIHTDPIHTDDPETISLREQVIQIVKEIDENLNIHDFRTAHGEVRTNLIFDIEMTFGYSLEETEKLVHQIQSKIQEIDSSYHCIIVLDKGYIGD